MKRDRILVHPSSFILHPFPRDYSEKQVASPGGHGAPGNGENVEVVTRLAESRIEHRLGEVQAPAGSLRDVWGR